MKPCKECGINIDSIHGMRKYCDTCQPIVLKRYQRNYVRKTKQPKTNHHHTTNSECMYIDHLSKEKLTKYIQAQAQRTDWGSINPTECMKYARARLATL